MAFRPEDCFHLVFWGLWPDVVMARVIFIYTILAVFIPNYPYLYRRFFRPECCVSFAA